MRKSGVKKIEEEASPITRIPTLPSIPHYELRPTLKSIWRDESTTGDLETLLTSINGVGCIYDKGDKITIMPRQYDDRI